VLFAESAKESVGDLAFQLTSDGHSRSCWR
jgi:hypothetical protein